MPTTLSVSATGPYGVVIDADKFGHGAVIVSWVRLPNGKFGQIQKHGGVNLGDVLVAINDINITSTPHADVKAMLSKSMPTKVLKFVSSTQYYREKKGATAPARNETGGKDLGNKPPPFLSTIKRARVNNFTSVKFGEYEIVCQLRLASLTVGKEKTFKWSVWKRFSDFEQLNTQLQKSLGWHMDKIAFPSSHTFVMSKLAPDFLEQRREELLEYWTKVIAIDKVTEFNKHHCSAALKAFIDVDGALLGDKSQESNEKESKEVKDTKPSNDIVNEGDTEEDDGENDSKKGGDTTTTTATAGARRGSRRLSSRSGSNKAVMRRGSSATTLGAKTSTTATTTSSSSSAPPAATPSSSSSSSSSSSPPPSSSTSSVTSSPALSAKAGAPPSNPARLNLLGSINALRKD